MQTLYTLIVYTPGEEGWHDRCGDFHSGKELELEIKYFTEEEKDNLAREFGYAKFYKSDSEIKLLINGHDPYEPHDALNQEEQNTLISNIDHIEALADKYLDKFKVEKERKDEQAKLIKQQKEEFERLQAKKRLEDTEKAELARLMSKYK